MGAEMEAKHTAKKAAKKVAKRATKKAAKTAPKKKLASNYMSLLLRSIYIKQTKQIRDRFKKPEAWCLHFHDKCRAALHDKLMAKQKKMAIATSLITEDSEDNTQLLALKQQVASANAAVAKAKRVLAVTQARRKQKKKAMQTCLLRGSRSVSYELKMPRSYMLQLTSMCECECLGSTACYI